MTTQRTTDVTLSTGQTVTVGVMNWQGYTRLKTRVIGLISGQAGLMIAEFMTMQSPPSDWSSAAKEALPRLMLLLNEALDAATPELIAASAQVPQGFDPLTLPLPDILALRAAAIEVNDLAALMEREKNFLAATLGRLLSQITGTPLTLPLSFGGPTGNQS